MSRRLRALAGVICLGAVAGCVQQYDKPDVAGEERARDEEECRRLNTVPRVSRPLVLSGGGIESYPFENLDRHGYRLCMGGKGYVVEPGPQ